MELNGKFLECLNPHDMRIAMRALGVLKGDKIVLSSEADMDRCYDFVVHDFRNSTGSNLIDLYVEKKSDVSGVEKEIIDASLASKSSLFTIVNVDPYTHTLELADLIGGGRERQGAGYGVQFKSCIESPTHVQSYHQF